MNYVPWGIIIGISAILVGTTSFIIYILLLDKIESQ